MAQISATIDHSAWQSLSLPTAACDVVGVDLFQCGAPPTCAIGGGFNQQAVAPRRLAMGGAQPPRLLLIALTVPLAPPAMFNQTVDGACMCAIVHAALTSSAREAARKHGRGGGFGGGAGSWAALCAAAQQAGENGAPLPDGLALHAVCHVQSGPGLGLGSGSGGGLGALYEARRSQLPLRRKQ